MPKGYPALMVENSGYAAILRGHDLPTDELEAAELSVIGKPEDGWFTEIEEVCLDYVPRVKWCSSHPLSGGWSCNQEGAWHSHWFEVRETTIEACHFTIIRHTDVQPDNAYEFCPAQRSIDNRLCILRAGHEPSPHDYSRVGGGAEQADGVTHEDESPERGR